MTKKIDLNKIKEEISAERENRTTKSLNMSESVGRGVSKRDVFLNELISARDNGRDTPATNLIKRVDNKVSEKDGGTGQHIIKEAPTQRNTQPPQTHNMSQNRDDKFYADLNNRGKQTLAESISAFQGKKPTQSSVNFGGNEYLTSLPQNQNSGMSDNVQMNEGALVENVKGVVNNYLSENLSGIFEGAIKDTIIEMYAVERINVVLNENRDLIKSVVIETIREIQEKNKAKAKTR